MESQFWGQKYSNFFGNSKNENIKDLKMILLDVQNNEKEYNFIDLEVPKILT